VGIRAAIVVQGAEDSAVVTEIVIVVIEEDESVVIATTVEEASGTRNAVTTTEAVRAITMVLPDPERIATDVEAVEKENGIVAAAMAEILDADAVVDVAAVVADVRAIEELFGLWTEFVFAVLEGISVRFISRLLMM